MKREFNFNGKSVGYYCIDFILNNTTQRYEKQPMIKDFKNSPPTDLKIEETHDPKIKIRSTYLLRGRTANKKCTFHLGLQKSISEPEKMFRSALDDTKKSEVHIVFSTDYQRMTMYVFNAYRVVLGKRPVFQKVFIQHLQGLNEWSK